MKLWAALDVSDGGDSDLLLLALDDFQPTAIEDRQDDGGTQVRVFFADAGQRDRALAGLPPEFTAVPVDVPDEDWARRSQQHLTPITVGRITIFPTAESMTEAAPRPVDHHHLLIPPSMGFGTGHHATTRLCVAALQTLDLAGRSVIDVGTGSGVLALAAWRLGAGAAVGIDYDADAIQSAEENRVFNGAGDRVRFAVGDFRRTPLPAADVVTANLTGAMIVQHATDLLRLLAAGGTLIISGVQVQEREAVYAALAAARLVGDSEEEGWIGAVFTLVDPPAV